MLLKIKVCLKLLLVTQSLFKTIYHYMFYNFIKETYAKEQVKVKKSKKKERIIVEVSLFSVAVLRKFANVKL